MSGLSGIIPKHSTYVAGGLPIGVDSKRRTVRLVPQTGVGPYTPNGSNVIRIDVPPSIGFLDTQNSYLRFRVSVDPALVDLRLPCYMDKNAMSWCERFEVISNNGSVIESIHDYNLLVNLLHKATSPDDYRLTAGKLLDNQGSRAERQANIVCNREYCVGLDASGIFGGNSKYLPCQFIQGSLTLEFQLAAFADCFVGVARENQQASYTIDNVEYVAECITFGQDFNNIFEQELRTRGVDIAFHSYRSHHHAMPGSGNQVIQLSQNSKSVKGCYVVIRDKNEYRSPKCESLSTYKSGRLQDYQFDLGGRLFPEFKLDLQKVGQSSAYASALNSFNHFRDHNGGTAIRKETYAPFNNVAKAKPTGAANNSVRNLNKSEITSRILGFLQVADYAQAGNDTSTHFKPLDNRDLAEIKWDGRYKLTYIDNDYYDANTQAQNKAKDSDVAEGANAFRRTDEFVYPLGFNEADGSVRLGQVAAKNGASVATSQNPDKMYALAWQPGNGGAQVDAAAATLPTQAQAQAGVVTWTYNRTDQTKMLVYLDLVPDDTDFYIGQTFETHSDEHERLISGMDTSNTVPLHINLTFGTTANENGPNLPIQQSDLMTAFIHYDAVLRLEPDGSVISSM